MTRATWGQPSRRPTVVVVGGDAGRAELCEAHLRAAEPALTPGAAAGGR